jgi:hypothetical protein
MVYYNRDLLYMRQHPRYLNYTLVSEVQFLPLYAWSETAMVKYLSGKIYLVPIQRGWGKSLNAGYHHVQPLFSTTLNRSMSQ